MVAREIFKKNLIMQVREDISIARRIMTYNSVDYLVIGGVIGRLMQFFHQELKVRFMFLQLDDRC